MLWLLCRLASGVIATGKGFNVCLWCLAGVFFGCFALAVFRMLPSKPGAPKA